MSIDLPIISKYGKQKILFEDLISQSKRNLVSLVLSNFIGLAIGTLNGT
jgi:hypothetical protein